MKDNEKILQVLRKQNQTKAKLQVSYKGFRIRIASPFSIVPLEARTQWNKIFTIMRGKDVQPTAIKCECETVSEKISNIYAP